MTREEIIALMQEVIRVEFSVEENPGSYGGSNYVTFMIKISVDGEDIASSTEYLTFPSRD